MLVLTLDAELNGYVFVIRFCVVKTTLRGSDLLQCLLSSVFMTLVCSLQLATTATACYTRHTYSASRLHRVTDLQPTDTEETPYYYTFKVQCTSCREVHDNWVGVSRHVGLIHLSMHKCPGNAKLPSIGFVLLEHLLDRLTSKAFHPALFTTECYITTKPPTSRTTTRSPGPAGPPTLSGVVKTASANTLPASKMARSRMMPRRADGKRCWR